MKPAHDRWIELERLFNEALGKEPDALAAWLAEVCPDELLRAEVERLLAASAGADQRLRDVVAGAVPPPPVETLEHIGPYRLLRELGRGGMGSVWLAERDDHQYEDRVAIKLIRADAVSPSLIRRFLGERQILANLKHPNIARLLDGGTTPDGRPYLVMEYIEGEPIDAYCDRHRLSVSERIDLVRQVCSALQFAHSNLIVHRDIKPGNILVTSDGVPRLLDFGIARILAPEAMADRMTETRGGARLMTPAYASPEQIRGDTVTTACDIYSIAVVLYELLTGRLPYRADGEQVHELARTILEGEPERPSDAVTAEPPDTADARNATITRLRRQLEGDVDNILLVALRKEPERRYASVEQFAADLGRHRDGHPVVARPDTWTYRTGKFVKRHRGAVAAGTSTFLMIAFSAVTVAIQANRIARERDIANSEREKAESVTSFLVDVFAAADPNNARGVEVTAREILAEGGRRVHSELTDQPDVQAAAMETIGKVYRALGEYDSAGSFLHAASDVRLAELGPRSLEYASSLSELGLLARILNRYDSAASYHERALDIRRHVAGQSNLNVARSLNALGVVEHDRENLQRAESLYVAARDMLVALDAGETAEAGNVANNLGDLYHTMGRWDEAIATHTENLALRRRVRGEVHMDVAYTLNNLASALEFSGRADEAEPFYRESLDIRRRLLPEDHPSVQVVINNLGGLRLRAGDWAGAAELYEQVVHALRARAAGEQSLATPLSNLSMAWVRMGRVDDALSASREATALMASAVGPRSVAVTYPMQTTALALQRLGRLGDAERMHREIVSIRRDAYGEEGHANVVFSVEGLASFLLDQKRPADALPLAEEAVATGRRVFGQPHGYMAEALLTAGRARVELGQPENAIPLLREALQMIEDTDSGQPGMAQSQSLLGRALVETGHIQEGVALLRSALEYFEAGESSENAWLTTTRAVLAAAS